MDAAEITQNMLGQVGITVDVRIIEWAAYLDMTARGDHEMFILGWVTVTGDPDYGLHATFHTENFGAAGNRTFYSNPQVDRLLDEGRVETDRARREQLYFQAQQIIRDEAPWVFQWAGEDLHGARNDLRGLKLHPSSHFPLWTIYFE
jgi:peptide/nickel transport system substrate-binding protein